MQGGKPMEITMRELRQVAILEKLKRREISQKVGADTLKCSVRAVKRRLKRYKAKGLPGLVHARRGCQGNRATQPEIRQKVMSLMRTKYSGWPPTHASQALLENGNITVPSKTLRVWMLQEGLWKKQRKRRRRRRWRERKECFGQMLQLDGSEHKWVADEYWVLVKFVDDATGRIFMRFYKNESFESVVDLSIRYLKIFGKPRSIYTDRGGVYKVNNNNEDGQRITDYERSLNMLGIELIHALSPQAKGRVERSFQTDQQRLVRELKAYGITDISEANDYLESKYIPKHNAKYAVSPRSNVNLHDPINDINLENIFVRTSQRCVSNDWTILYNNKRLQLDSSRPATVKPKDIVTFNERLDNSIFITIRKETITFEEIKNTPKREFLIPANPSFYRYKPPANHPWRRFKLSL